MLHPLLQKTPSMRKRSRRVIRATGDMEPCRHEYGDPFQDCLVYITARFPPGHVIRVRVLAVAKDRYAIIEQAGRQCHEIAGVWGKLQHVGSSWRRIIQYGSRRRARKILAVNARDTKCEARFIDSLDSIFEVEGFEALTT